MKTRFTGKRKNKKEGYPLVLYTVNPSGFPWSFPVLLSQELALLLSFQLVFSGRGCCADSQVCAPGGAALPRAGCQALWELFTP